MPEKGMIERTLYPGVTGAVMMVRSCLPHPVDVEVGQNRAGSQDGAHQKKGDKVRLHDVARNRKDLRRLTAMECGLGCLQLRLKTRGYGETGSQANSGCI